MGYATQADIEADFKDIVISASGTPVTVASCADMINQESAYIDAMIGKRYVVPVDESSYPSAFLILKRICIFRVSLRIRNILEVKAEETQESSIQKYDQNGVRTPNDDLKMISEGDLPLSGVPLNVEDGAVSSFGINCGASNIFKTDRQQW